MIVTEHLDLTKPIEYTPEEIKMLDDLEHRPIVYDDECPKLSAEQIEKIHRAYSRNKRVTA